MPRRDTAEEVAQPVAQDVPAIGYSVNALLKGERSMTIQCYVGEGETDAQVNAKIDRIFRVVDRQRARYELADLRIDLDKAERGLTRFDEDLARVDTAYTKRLAEFDQELLLVAERRQANEDAARIEHDAGRRGAFKLAGKYLGEDGRCEHVKQQILDAKHAAAAEREANIDQIKVNHKRFEDELAQLRKDIAAREALLATG